MISYQVKYQIKSFTKRNYLLLRLLLIVLLINITFWVTAFFNYFDDNSIGSFYDNIINVVKPFLAAASIDLFIDSPWSIITSFFTYTSLFQLIMDALFILIIGNLFLEFFSSKRMWWTLFWGHLGAFIFFVTPTLLFPQLDINVLSVNQLGVSGAAYGLFFAIVATKPKFQIPIFKYHVSIQTIGLVFLAINIVSMNNLNFLTMSSHLGASIIGFLYGLGYAKKVLPLWGKKSMKFHRGTAPRSPVSDDEYNARRADDEQRINRILDKISKTGYEQLSAEEKEFLFKYKRK